MPPDHSELEWEKHRDLLWCLWVKDRRPLPSLVAEMAAVGFEASPSDYKSHFKAWRFAKNHPSETWKYVGLAFEKRKREDKESVAIVDGLLVPSKRLKHETSRHFYTKTEMIADDSPSTPIEPMITVCTPPAMEFELEWPPSLPFFHLKGILPGLFPIPSTPGLSLSTQSSLAPSQQQISTATVRPFSKLLNTAGWLKDVRSPSVTQLSACLGTWVPEAFPGEHILQAQQISTNRCHDPWIAYLRIIVYMASNNHLGWRSEEDIFRQFVESGIWDRNINVDRSQLIEPVIRAFLEQILKSAISRQHQGTLRWLFRLGIKLSLHLPLILVSDFEYDDMIEELLSSGAKPDEYCCPKHGTPLDFAAYQRDFLLLEEYVQHQKAYAAYQTQYDPPPTSLLSESNASQCTTLAEIFLAIDSYDLPRLKEMYRQGVNFNMQSQQGMFPLGLAVMSAGSLILCEELLRMGASPNFDPSNPDDDSLPSVLHIASVQNDLQVFTLLLKHGAHIHKPARRSIALLQDPLLSTDEDESDLLTPLELAIDLRRWSCAELLVSNGAPLRGHELLQAVKVGEQQSDTLIQSLVEHGIDLKTENSTGETALHVCLTYKHQGTARLLLKLGSHIDEYASELMHRRYKTLGELWVADEINLNPTPSIVKAAWENRELHPLRERIQDGSVSGEYVLEVGATHWDVKLDSDTTSNAVLDLIRIVSPNAYSSAMTLSIAQALPIHSSKSRGLAQFLRKALSGRNPSLASDVKDKYALLCAINHAASSGEHEAMELILENLFPNSICMVNPWYNPFVPIYASSDREPTLYSFSWMMIRHGPVSNLPPSQQHLALHFRSECVQTLLQRGSQPNTAAGLTAVTTGSIPEVRNLILLGFSPHRRYPWSLTALQCAVQYGWKDMVSFLLDEGASPTACPPWKNLTPTPHPECPKSIRVEPGDKDRRTAFQYAVQNKDWEMMELLRNHGADINEPPARYAGATALQVAAIKGYIGITKKLIDLGADINAAKAPYRGRTALEGAAEHGRLDTVALLLAEGCQIHGEGREQYVRAIKLARDNEHATLAWLLETRGMWTDEDERNLAACKIDHEEYDDPHKMCSEGLCCDYRSMMDTEDEPRCWEARSGVVGAGLILPNESHTTTTTQDEGDSMREVLNDYPLGGMGEQEVSAGDLPVDLMDQSVQFDVGEYTEVDPMSSWGDWAFDDAGNFLVSS